MSEKLGNYTYRADFFNGVQIGETTSSDDFKVGKHCTGATYDGESVGSFWLTSEGESFDEVGCNITNIRDGTYMLVVDNTTTLDNLEKILEDSLHHVRQLKLGKKL